MPTADPATLGAAMLELLRPGEPAPSLPAGYAIEEVVSRFERVFDGS